MNDCSLRVSYKALKSCYFLIWENHMHSWNPVKRNCEADFLQSVFKEHLVSFPRSPFPVSCVWFPVSFTSALHVSVMNLCSPRVPKLLITCTLAGFIYEFSSWCCCLIKSNFPGSFTRVFTSCERLQGSVSPKRKRKHQGGSHTPLSLPLSRHRPDRLSCVSKPEFVYTWTRGKVWQWSLCFCIQVNIQK